MKIYYGNKKVALFIGVFFFAILFIGLTLPLLLDDKPIKTNEIQGLSFFYILALIFTLIPLASKLEVGNDYIKTYLLGFLIHEIRAKDVTRIWFTWVYAKGGYIRVLKIHALVDGKRKKYSFAEDFFGKEALAHAIELIESKRPK